MNELKDLYKKYTIQEIIKMDAFETAEITCKRMMVKFRNEFSKNKKDIKIQPTPNQTLFDAKMTYLDKNNNSVKAHLEFKNRKTLYSEMFIEVKNVNHALKIKEKGINYMYINFYDDINTGLRHMYMWSSMYIDFNKLDYEMKEIGITEVEDKGSKYQKRFKLPLNKVTEHHIINITELWKECQTQEYINLLFNL